MALGKRLRQATSLVLRELGLRQGPLPRLHLPDESEARRALALVDQYSMAGYHRLVTLWSQVRFTDQRQLEGCLVECGTCQGGAAGMMALAHLAAGPATRAIHLFDSFEGLPEPVAELDGPEAVAVAGGADRASGKLNTINYDVGKLEVCQRVMASVAGYPEALTHYHVGWFQDTVAAAAGSLGPIALLRIDGDWYESTRICLESLYPLVVPGGFVIIDDYGHWEGCRRAVEEYFQRRLDRRPYVHLVDGSCRYVIAGS